MDRRPIMAANWKMNKTRAEAQAFCEVLLPRAAELDRSAEIVLCPPFTALAPVAERCEGTPVEVAAQNMHEAESGAYTGEISAGMLTEAGAWGAILGHSERRGLFGEGDEALARKVLAALEAGLVPILCVGETEAQREAAETEAVLRRQLEADLFAVPDERLAELVIAYEPVWAIGTGRTATPEQAEEAIGFVRSVVAERSSEAGAGLRIQYGGSVKPSNARELLGRDEIDGALVGGASLDPDEFAAIAEAAA